MMVPESFFASDYAAARARFRDAVTAAGGQLTDLALDSKEPDGADLTIDIGWFGSEQPRRALPHCSGIHGVEGFAGSAIQLQRLDEGVHGIPSLKEAIVSGQYEHPRGLFFGGAELQQGPQLFERVVREGLRTSNRVVVVDIHTGLGKREQDAILEESPLEDSDMYREIEEAFGHRVAPLDARRSVAYQFRGAFYSMFDRALPDADVYFVAQEFGTYREVRMLKALREENRSHHYGSASVDHPTKRILRERFCPEAATWRTTVLARGSQVLDEAHALAFGHE